MKSGLSLGRRNLKVLRFFLAEQRSCLRFWIFWMIDDFSYMDRTGYVLLLQEVV